MMTRLLVRHPAPLPTESFFGYFLRLSEQNGYATPFSLLRLLGTKPQSSRRIRIDALARVANRHVSDLKLIETILESGHNFRLLGQSVSPQDLRLKTPALCPECVASTGFIEAHWDLKFMIGCPIHHHDLVAACPECNLPLRWFRRGLLECSCGAEILGVDLSPIPDETAALLGIIRCRALGIAPPSDTSLRLPTAELSAMTLRALLLIIRIIGKHRLMIDNPANCQDPKRVVGAAGAVLANFPLNFYELLRQIGERLPQIQSHSSVRRQYSAICTGLLKRLPIDSPDHTDFLRLPFWTSLLITGKREPWISSSLNG